MDKGDPKRIHNEELIDLLFREEDRIPRSIADEIIRRGAEMSPALSDIVMDKLLWIAPLPEWWAPVHATYLLGAIGGQEVLDPLLAALRWADAFENEWVTEDLPSILGSLGNISYQPLTKIVGDKSAGWSARSIAMDALGSQAMRFPNLEEDIMAGLGRILSDATDETGARRSAAYVLLDFRRSDLKGALIEFAKTEEERQRQQLDYKPAFTARDVANDLTTPRSGEEFYMHNWLEFYNDDEVIRRQRHWQDEDSRDRLENPQPAGALVGRQGFVIGRNAPCPCGSGKPYKRCCMKKIH